MITKQRQEIFTFEISLKLLKVKKFSLKRVKHSLRQILNKKKKQNGFISLQFYLLFISDLCTNKKYLFLQDIYIYIIDIYTHTFCLQGVIFLFINLDFVITSFLMPLFYQVFFFFKSLFFKKRQKFQLHV